MYLHAMGMDAACGWRIDRGGVLTRGRRQGCARDDRSSFVALVSTRRSLRGRIACVPSMRPVSSWICAYRAGYVVSHGPSTTVSRGATLRQRPATRSFGLWRQVPGHLDKLLDVCPQILGPLKRCKVAALRVSLMTGLGIISEAEPFSARMTRIGWMKLGAQGRVVVRGIGTHLFVVLGPDHIPTRLHPVDRRRRQLMLEE